MSAPQKPFFIHALVLGGFSMAAAGLLAGGDKLTAEEIRQRALEDLQASLTQVIPAAIHDNSPVADAITLKRDGAKDLKVYRAKKGGRVTGVAYEVSGSGYAGEIKIIMGIDPEGRLTGVRVVKHAETPGLGDKIEPAKSDWINRFSGLSLGNPPAEKWKVRKDGGQFDQFSGATITPRAVVGAIKEGLIFFNARKTDLLREDGKGTS